jgi:hypothetical protein
MALAALLLSWPAHAQESPERDPGEITPTMDSIAKLFSGHGGFVVGAGPVASLTLGKAAGGSDGAMTDSHGLGYGASLQIGMLFKRRFGVFGHGAVLNHMAGSREPSSV